MNKNRLKEVLSIPSVYGEEGLVRDYIQSYAENEGIEYHISHQRKWEDDWRGVLSLCCCTYGYSP